MRNSNTHRGSSKGPQDSYTTVVATSPPHAAFDLLSHLGEESHCAVPPPPHHCTNSCGHKINASKRLLFDSTQWLFRLNPKPPNCNHRCTTARPSSAICRREPSILLSVLHPAAKSSSDRYHMVTMHTRKGGQDQKRELGRTSILTANVPFPPLALCKSTVAPWIPPGRIKNNLSDTVRKNENRIVRIARATWISSKLFQRVRESKQEVTDGKWMW